MRAVAQRPGGAARATPRAALSQRQAQPARTCRAPPPAAAVAAAGRPPAPPALQAQRARLCNSNRVAAAVQRRTRRTAVAAAAGAPAPSSAGDAARAASATADDGGVPSLRALIGFTVPFMAVWMANPLLSLMDTSIVGLGSTLELSALAPATTISNNLVHVLGFMGIATTSLVAGAAARGDDAAAAAAAREALGIAAAAGVACGVLLAVFATPALAAFAGPACGELVAPAAAYTRIRALGMPFALTCTVAQAASLAYRDARPPLMATAVAAAVNLFGDLFLCCGLGWGIRGAAWATVAAQAAAAATAMWLLQRPGPPAEGAVQRRRPPLLRSWLCAPPPLPACVRFAGLGGPVAFVILLKVGYFTAVTQAAVSLSPVAAGAHGVMISIFVCLGVLGDATSQVCQGFMPAAIGSPARARALALRLMQLGACVGVVNATAYSVVAATCPGLFTTSAEVAAGMAAILPVAATSLLLHNASMASEGIMLASRQLSYLVRTYSLGAAAAVATLAFTVSAGLGLPGVWLAVLQFQITRLAQNGLRLFVSRASPLAVAAAGA